MKKIKSYSQILDSVKERVSIMEMALNPERIDKVKRFKDVGDISN
jgi:hypothetical protein